MGLGKASKETQQRAQEQNAARANRGTILPDGMYCLAITEVGVLRTKKGGQAMGLIKMAPCRADGKRDTADLTKELVLFVMGQDIEDMETFRAGVVESAQAAQRREYAKAHGCSIEDAPEPSDYSEEEIDTLVQDRLANNYSQMANAAVAIFGKEELPEVPLYDREKKVFRFKDGTETDKTEKDRLILAQREAAVDMLNEAFDEERDISKYVVYGMLKERTYNGRTESAVSFIKEALGPKDNLVPASKWCPED